MELILVIEDEQVIRETLGDILSLAGHKVAFATNGKEGLEMILKHKPIMVICDVQMPEMDGFTLLETLNEKIGRRKVPAFIFLTAKVEKKEIEKGVDLGAVAYINKPYDHICLLCTINRELKRWNFSMDCDTCENQLNAPKYLESRDTPAQKSAS